jgi:hypothetical protein
MPQLDEFHQHEAVDRLDMVICMIEEHVAAHPFIEAHLLLKQKVDQAVKLLSETYQEAAAVDMNLPEKLRVWEVVSTDMALPEKLKAWAQSPEGKQAMAEALARGLAEVERLEECQRIKPAQLTQRYAHTPSEGDQFVGMTLEQIEAKIQRES